MGKIFARDEEKGILDDFLNSLEAKFLAIYGRRRIGKTYLIRNYFAAKKKVFRSKTSTKKQIFIALISANGVKQNRYVKEYIDSVVTLKDLFS